jgi:hypothetical protein
MVGYQICTKFTASSFIMSEDVTKMSINIGGQDNTVNRKTTLPIYLSEDVLLYPLYVYRKLRFVLLLDIQRTMHRDIFL